jgi:pyruvate dehydrogenase E1 component beta subunit
MPCLTYRDALGAALRDALTHDSRVFLIHEDVGRYGGVYAVSKGLLKRIRTGAHPQHAAV